MISSLGSLKMILQAIAFAAAAALFLLLQSIISFVMDRRGREIKGDWALSGKDYPDGFTKMNRYGRIIRKETMKHIWLPAAAGTSCLILLAFSAFFHRKIIGISGAGPFVSLFLLLCFISVCCSFVIKGWKSRACSDLGSFTDLFAGAAHDIHAGIRMMLACTEVDIPLKNVLLAVQNDNPGISGTDLLKKTGSVLGSEIIISDSGKNLEDTGNHRYLAAFSAVISISSFGIILFLIMLL